MIGEFGAPSSACRHLLPVGEKTIVVSDAGASERTEPHATDETPCPQKTQKPGLQRRPGCHSPIRPKSYFASGSLMTLPIEKARIAESSMKPPTMNIGIS
jgi:hypothetical protein